MTPEIQNILDSFNTIRLEEMENVKLMNRIDTKYLLPVNRIPDLLGEMQNHYSVLNINNIKSSSYNTIYLDSPEFAFFIWHVTGKSGRTKVRFRTYNSTGTTFLEVKKKTKKGRTVKWRTENSFDGYRLDVSALDFLKKRLDFSPEILKPVLSNTFTRMTFKGFDVPERLTVDLELSFSSPEGSKADFPLIAVAELKSSGLPSRSLFSRIIKQFSVYPSGFSKYCMGCVLLNDVPLKNLLKPKILLLKRIENECTGSLSA